MFPALDPQFIYIASDFVIFLLILITMPEYHCNYSSNSFWPVLVLWGRKYVLVRRSYIIVGSKLCYCGLKAILLWAQSYVIAGSKLYYCGLEAMLLRARSYVSNVVNAIEKDRLLRSE